MLTKVATAIACGLLIVYFGNVLFIASAQTPDLTPAQRQQQGRLDAIVRAQEPTPIQMKRPEQQKTHEYLYWEAAGTKQDTVQQAVRWGNWKAVRNKVADKFELYDLSKDIGEEHNVAAEHPEVMAKIDAICREAHTPERKYEPADPEGINDYVR